MTLEQQPEPSRTTAARAPSPPSWVWGVLAFCLVVLLAGSITYWKGCGHDTGRKQAAEKKKKDEKKKKPKPKRDFAVAPPRILPYDERTSGNLIKPGHWSCAWQEALANNFPFTGELHSSCADKNGLLLDLERTPFCMAMSRPASLPKGQTKHLEMIYFVPRQYSNSDTTLVALKSNLTSRRSGRRVYSNGLGDLKNVMKEHEYFFVVLARNPDAYAYLRVLDSVRPPCGDILAGRDTHYHVILPRSQQHVPLPSNPLTWTSIAYILWDDADLTLLTPDQRRAMVDWLHWGGQLIVSGPGSLAGLKASFLAEYLPAESGDPVKLQQEAFDEINAFFTLADGNDKRGGGRQPLTVILERPPEGIDLIVRPGAEYVSHTGRLLAQRRVGRGRIVVSAFPMTSRTMINWPHFDGFFNACLLRRPAREFSKNEFGDLDVNWAEASLKPYRFDARLISGLRYFSRDMGYLSASKSGAPPPRRIDDIGTDPGESPPAGETTPQQWPDGKVAWEIDSPVLFDGGYGRTPGSGVAAWTDFSGVADAARRSLKEAAGITIPKASFVLLSLFVYLSVLVPLNWAVFRMIGRLEWAWIAAPLIAIVGTFAVIHFAQLDIGFARSQTEVAVLELQGSHPRGHLSRYTALYTSLQTVYDVQFDDDTTLAQPFSAGWEFERMSGQAARTVTLRRDRKTSLRGLSVRSNFTGMLHSEQMFDVGGSFELTGAERSGFKLKNDSGLNLQGVGVIRRTAGEDGYIEVAWIGTLEAKTAARVRFGYVNDARALLTEWENSPTTASRAEAGMINLRHVLNLARDPRRIGPGEVRMIGWTDVELPGMTVAPAAAQTVCRTLVVSHLRYGPLPAPTPDVNTRPTAKEEPLPELEDLEL